MIVSVIRVVVVVMTMVVTKVRIITVFMITVLMNMARYHVSKTMMINPIVIVARVVTISELESESVSVELCRQCSVVYVVLGCQCCV